MSEPGGNDIEVFIPGVLRGAFEKWLSTMHLELFSIPTEDTRIPSYEIGISRPDK